MLIDLTHDPLARLLVDATRHREVAGAKLADAHRAVGRALAQPIARHLVLEETEIEHVMGRSTGVRIAPDEQPIIVAILRSGLFVAEGLWDQYPGSGLVLYNPGADRPLAIPPARTVIIVDAVINTGRSIAAAIETFAPFAKHVLVATLVGFRPAVLSLVDQFVDVDFIAARLSERSYVGSGSSDTGARLYGTSSWSSDA